MNELRIGDLLDERFEIRDLIGRGGMGSVFKAMDLTTGTTVAIKVPFFEFESDPGFYARFQREAAIGQRLRHPAVLSVILVERPSRPYLVMEYLQGETLWDRLRRTPAVSIEEALSIAGCVAAALVYLHGEGIVHRDLKPTNVMLCSNGSIRIMDFGVAMMAATRRLTISGLTGRFGTPEYMAPEQIKGGRGDARMDIYSLGAVLYEMVTGHIPFDDHDDLYWVMNARLVGDPIAPRQHNPALAPQVEEIILHAMARHPADRHATAAALKGELDAPDAVLVTGRATRLVTPSLGAHRWRLLRTVGIALAIPVVLFFVFLLILKH